MTYDRTLIVIRERSFLEILDLALLVVRQRPLALFLAALAGIAPFAVLNVWLLSDPQFSRGAWVGLLIMEIPWATAPLTLVLGDLMFCVQPRPLRIMKVLALSAPALFVNQLVVRAGLLFLIVGIILIPSRHCFLNEVMLLEPRTRRERLRPWLALRRSPQICRGFEGELLIRAIGQIVLGLTFAICFQNGMSAIGSVIGGGEITWDEPGLADTNGLLFQLGVWIAIAYFAVVRFLSYIDRRIRLEGWEIELRLKAVGRALEERPQ